MGKKLATVKAKARSIIATVAPAQRELAAPPASQVSERDRAVIRRIGRDPRLTPRMIHHLLRGRVSLADIEAVLKSHREGQPS
jgi:hypothetical protein